MLSAHAYSLRQKSRLAISLSWISGFTNVVALMAMGAFVSHVTGTSTLFARAIGTRDRAQILFFGWLLLTFLAGAALSALLTETAKRHGWRSKYILPIAVEAILLSAFGVGLWLHPSHAVEFAFSLGGLASLAMGLQNATVTKISGSIVRTTHVTGIFTDLGLEGVQYLFWLRDRLKAGRPDRVGRLMRVSRRHPSAQRVLLLASIAGSFGFGATIGCIAYLHFSAPALLVPVCFLMWIIFVDVRTPIADVRDMDLLNDPELKLHDLVNQLLPREIGLYRFACARGNLSHRAPNFQLWVDRVPERCKVVVLAVSPLTRFDANAVMDLEAAVTKLGEHDRHLILCGLTNTQYRALEQLHISRAMDPNDLCPDLEFGIARALSYLPRTRGVAA